MYTPAELDLTSLCSVARFIVPIQSIVKHLRPSSMQNPIKLELDVLNQVTRNLGMSHVCGVIERSDVIVLQQSSGVEVMNKWSRFLV